MKIKRRNKANPDFSLAAMVDVILLLLIFFMVTSAASNISAVNVNLPKGTVDNPNIPDEVVVSIQPDGRFYVNDVPTPKESLESSIFQKMQGKKNPSFTIRADENTLHKDVVFVMEIAEKNHFNIAIATTKEPK
ncbi:MAG: biopolymer transporter ExbD [Bacteroidetes bacterium]|nr:biopolymer transporter ExbD [Bacteroidota bacterium]